MSNAKSARLYFVRRRLRPVVVCLCLLVSLSLGVAREVQAADTNISVQVCHPVTVAPPSISSPDDGTTTNDSSVLVSGSAPANEVVYAFRQGSQVGFVTADTFGGYSISVNLTVGDNTIHTSTKNSCDQFFDSSPITVTRNTPPQPPQQPDEGAESPPSTPPAQPPSSTPGTESPIESPPGVSPQITQPQDGIRLSDPTVLVEGTAAPFAIVRINLNGQVVAEVIADEHGRFRVSVMLKEGENKLFVTVGEGDGELRSPTVIIYYGPLAPVSFLARSPNRWVRIARVVGVVFAIGFIFWLSWAWLLALLRRRHKKGGIPPEKRS